MQKSSSREASEEAELAFLWGPCVAERRWLTRYLSLIGSYQPMSDLASPAGRQSRPEGRGSELRGCRSLTKRPKKNHVRTPEAVVALLNNSREDDAVASLTLSSSETRTRRAEF